MHAKTIRGATSTLRGPFREKARQRTSGEEPGGKHQAPSAGTQEEPGGQPEWVQRVLALPLEDPQRLAHPETIYSFLDTPLPETGLLPVLGVQQLYTDTDTGQGPS